MAGTKRVGVFAHGNGSWRFQVKDPQSGKWRQIVATRSRFEKLGVPLKSPRRPTKAEAHRLKEKYEELLREAQAHNLPTEDIALSQGIAEYLRYQRNAPQYLKDKERILGQFRQAVGDLPIRDISKADLAEFERYLRGRGGERPGEMLHPTTVSRYLRYVRQFFNFSYREGWVLRSPFLNFRIPADQSKPIQVFTLDEIGKIVSWLRESEKDREYAIWMISGFLALGLRCIELQALNWEDVDMEKRFVKIELSKNLESRRPQPIPRCLMPMFETRRMVEGPLFPTQCGEPTSKHQMSSLARRIAKEFPGFNWQRLRRTYATLLQKAGVDALIIDRLLGHSSRSSSIRVTAQHYIGKEYGFYQSLVDEAFKPLGLVLATAPQLLSETARHYHGSR